jgi:hypothetical protein
MASISSMVRSLTLRPDSRACSSIAENLAGSNGGGIYKYRGSQFIGNSIVWGNRVSTTPNNIYNAASYIRPAISHSDIQGCGGSGGSWVTSLGVDLGGNIDYIPGWDGGWRPQQFTSPPLNGCIDGGDNSFIHETFDIGGDRRIRYSIVDMGAYEYKGVASQVHFSGIGIADGRYLPNNDVYSPIPFVADEHSDILEPDHYPYAEQVLANVTKYFTKYTTTLQATCTLDSIAVHANTRVRMWDQPNYQGNLVLDVTGPAIIYNAWRRDLPDSDYVSIKDADFSPQALQNEFPQSCRYWSDRTSSPEIHPAGDGRMSYQYHDASWIPVPTWEIGSIKIDPAP